MKVRKRMVGTSPVSETSKSKGQGFQHVSEYNYIKWVHKYRQLS